MQYSSLLLSVFAAAVAAQTTVTTETSTSLTTESSTTVVPTDTSTSTSVTVSTSTGISTSTAGSTTTVLSSSLIVNPTFTSTTTASLYGNLTTTVFVTAFTTYCPQPTILTINDICYTVTEPTTLTVTNCPCTVVKPVPTQPACTTCKSPAVATASTGLGTVTRIPGGATSTPYVTVAAAGRETAFAGLLAAAVGIAVYGVAAL